METGIPGERDEAQRRLVIKGVLCNGLEAKGNSGVRMVFKMADTAKGLLTASADVVSLV